MNAITRTRIGMRTLAGFGIVLVATACSGSAPQPSASTRAPTASTAASVGPTDSPSVAPAGSGRVDGQVIGSGTLPAWSVEMPSDWSTDGHFVTKSGSSIVGFSVWQVDQVPSDPCHWKGTLVRPGPSVDDLVRALVAQRTRNATQPTAVTLAGHSGMYLEWSVPADAVVTGDSDFAGCDMWPDNAHRDFVSWLATAGSDRYQQVAGQADRLWVLDVDGQRLLADATYSPDSTALDRMELGHVAESLQFKGP